MTPCYFCGQDSDGGLTGHISSKPAECGIVPYCGECSPIRLGTIGLVHPEDYGELVKELGEREMN